MQQILAAYYKCGNGACKGIVAYLSKGHKLVAYLVREEAGFSTKIVPGSFSQVCYFIKGSKDWKSCLKDEEN